MLIKKYPSPVLRRLGLASLLGLCVSLGTTLTAFAAFNDVTLTTSAVVSVGGNSLNISGSSAVVQSMVVNANSFDVTLLSGSSFVVSSATGKGFTTSVSGVSPSITVSCGGTSVLTLAPAGTVTVTVTPVATCTVLPVVAPVSSGGGGGGGSLTTPVSPQTPVSTVPVSTAPVIPPPTVVTVISPFGPATPPPAPVVKEEGTRGILSLEDANVLTAALGVSRDLAIEARVSLRIKEDLAQFGVVATALQLTRLTNFVTYGNSVATKRLGEGERRALIRDALETMKKADISSEDLDRMARGIIPSYRNLTSERLQLPAVRATFRTIFGHDPNFRNTDENLAWNTLMYRIRFERDLAAEKQGILDFRKAFSKAPQTPFQWAAVRVMGYIQK